MNSYTKRAVDLMMAARPASGFRPETEAEWVRLQHAVSELAYAVYRNAGLPEAQAREIAYLIYASPEGRLLLDIAFSEEGHA